MPYVFDKFYRAKSSEIKKNTGTGIGLALTKGLIEIHHGCILVESKQNIETNFSFIFPIDRAAYLDEEIVSNDTNNSKKNLFDEFNLKEKQNAEILKKADLGNDNPEILVVEDNDELRDFLESELGKNSKSLLLIMVKQGLKVP